MSGPSVFDVARRLVPIEDLAGKVTKLTGAGADRRGPCPICGSKGKSGHPFSVKPERGTWRCWADCDRGGDVVDLYVELHGGAPYDAALALAGPGWKAEARPVAPKPEAAEPAGPSASERIAAELWAEGRPVLGTRVQRYLEARGIAAAVVEAAAMGLRYHPFAKAAWDAEARAWVKAPAMLAQVVTPAGPTGGVHATYLHRTEPARDKTFGKKMWGPQSRDGRPGGAWLIGPDGAGDLVTGEGIETTLSLASFARGPVRAVAALSLGRLQGGWLLDEDGCFDPADVRPNPKAPAFTWPVLDGAAELVIGLDRDMSPLRDVKSRNGRGKVITVTLDGEARARLCGRLACAAWRAAGWTRVRAIAPPPRTDFNDVLRGRNA